MCFINKFDLATWHARICRNVKVRHPGGGFRLSSAAYEGEASLDRDTLTQRRTYTPHHVWYRSRLYSSEKTHRGLLFCRVFFQCPCFYSFSRTTLPLLDVFLKEKEVLEFSQFRCRNVNAADLFIKHLITEEEMHATLLFFLFLLLI